MGIMASLFLLFSIIGIMAFIMHRCSLPGCPIIITRIYQDKDEADAARDALDDLPRSPWRWCPRLNKKSSTHRSFMEVSFFATLFLWQYFTEFFCTNLVPFTL
jgi:hypothetical protein